MGWEEAFEEYQRNQFKLGSIYNPIVVEATVITIVEEKPPSKQTDNLPVPYVGDKE